MKIICISDTHTMHSKVKLPDGDILLYAGDFSDQGSFLDTISFLKWFESCHHKHKIFISGNHDWLQDRNPTFFEELRKEHAPSCICLNDTSVTIDGLLIHGSPVSPFFCSWAFNKHRGDEIYRHWAMIPDETDILITHGPPYGFGDKLSKLGSEPGQRVGCHDLLRTIDSRLKNLKLHVFGHIHEGYGIYQHKNITLINASLVDDCYDLVNRPFSINI